MFKLHFDVVLIDEHIHLYIYTFIHLFRLNLTLPCNGHCGCNQNLFVPVCVEKTNYFTPCHAGCENQVSSKMTNHHCKTKYSQGIP